MNGILGESSAETVPALRRAVRILDFVSSAESAPNAADLARVMAIPKSTAHGLLSAMVELGLLARSHDGFYRPGAHVMQWANGFLAQQNIVREFQNHFAENSALSEHTVTLTVLDGTDVIYLGCRNSNKPLGFTFRIGMRLPATFTATGKAQLEAVPLHQLEDMFSAYWPDPITRSSVKNLAALKDELREIRKRGYSIDDGQIREGMICLGAAIRDFSGHSIGGVAISLIESEALPNVLDRLGLELRQTADALSKRLGA